MAKTPIETADIKTKDMDIVFDFLNFSAPDLPDGTVLHDHLMASLALALHQRTPAH